MAKRVVITSMGVISSLGINPDEIIKNLNEDNVTFERPSFDNDVVTCPIKGFNVKDFSGRFKYARYLNRGAELGLAAAIEAIKDSGLDQNQLVEAGIFAGAGPNMDISGEFPEIKDGNLDREDLAALWILKFLPNTLNSAIAQYAGIHGENLTINTACSASLQAIGEGYRKIKDGYLSLAFAGGGDSRISRGGILSYKKAQALYTGSDEPENSCMPFDARRKGFVPGEGGAFFLLEDMEHARSRGANIIAEICGFGSSIDGYNMTAPEPSGKWGEKAIYAAMDESEISPDNIDIISTHGTGTPLNDDMESNIVARIFGDMNPPVISLKSWIGHVAAACGALELAICLSCMREDYLPRIRNLEEPCNDNINFVRNSKEHSIKTALLENFGFGGQNSALIIKALDK